MPVPMPEMREMPGPGGAGRRVRVGQCEGLPLCEGLAPVFEGQVFTKRYSFTLMVRLRPPVVVVLPGPSRTIFADMSVRLGNVC